MNNCDSEAVGEVAVDTLKPYDFIVIKTVNSTYRFLAVDPARRRGLLMGGVCGRAVVASVLYGAKFDKGNQELGLLSGLHQGSRAVFFVATNEGVKTLVTSTITKLSRTRRKDLLAPNDAGALKPFASHPYLAWP